MPPLIKTILFETMYVPMIPQVMLVRIAPNEALMKKLYWKSSRNIFLVFNAYAVLK
jgi:hypothetical protein